MNSFVNENINLRNSALTAGISLVIMSLAAFFSYGYVHESLVVQNDASSTFNNITTSTTLFKAGVFGWLVILICDILVAWGLYIFLKPINKNISLLSAWLRLIYSSILAISVLNLIVVLLLTSSPYYLSSFNIEQLQAYVKLFLDAFNYIWSIGLIVFGGHLLLVGYLSFSIKNLPKIISILLILASVSYIIIHIGHIFLSQYNEIFSIIGLTLTVPMALGELSFAVWLLFKGSKITKNEQLLSEHS